MGIAHPDREAVNVLRIVVARGTLAEAAEEKARQEGIALGLIAAEVPAGLD
jgi:hypothetical protein